MSAPPPVEGAGDERGDPHAALRASWEANAAAWTAAVRTGAIPSRRAGTDAAVLAACAPFLPGRTPARVLDLGCGEGWLAHALARRGADVLGVDASAPLVAEAERPPERVGERAADGDAGAPGARARFAVLDYAALVADDDAAAGPFDLVVCNFALLGDPVAPLLAAVSRRLAPGGRLVIQTVHPWAAAGDGPYVAGWRTETFAAFAVPFPAAMPWYFRPLGDWVAALADGGLRLEALHEPLHPETGRPLSLLLVATAARG